MKTSHILLALAAVLLTIFGLSLAWEFYFEDLIAPGEVLLGIIDGLLDFSRLEAALEAHGKKLVIGVEAVV